MGVLARLLMVWRFLMGMPPGGGGWGEIEEGAAEGGEGINIVPVRGCGEG